METEKEISVEDASELAHVSSATIHNWVKTGYLKKGERGMINKVSFNHFMENVAGKEKLIQRANKLKKDSQICKSLSEIISENSSGKSWSQLGELYEGSLSNSYRNKEGIYYTPRDITEDLFSGIKITKETTFLDPCCGSGNFIIEAIKRGVSPQNVYGFDVDSNAVEITRKRIEEETGYKSDNIRNLDFLIESESMRERYDLIITNPPWGKKLKKEEKLNFSLIYGAGKSVDTTSLFYFASMNLLKDDGVLGFLVQEAVFNIASFEDTRKNMLANRILRMVDYGKPFKGILAKAQAFVIEKSPIKNSQVSCEIKEGKHTREQQSFSYNVRYNLNFWTTEEEAKVIDRFYRANHTTLENKARWALGIVTGNNSKYCVKEERRGYVPVFKGADIKDGGLNPPSNFIPDDFSNFQQVAPLELYQAPSKIIYKFISSKLVFFHDTQKRYILNSANLLIPNDELEISCQQLADLLSSELSNWVFKHLFNTHKVLRGDLEKIPIHTEYFREHEKFNEKSYLAYLGINKNSNGTFTTKN